MDYSFGPKIAGDHVEFRLWAPLQANVALKFKDQSFPMRLEADGWHALVVKEAAPCDRYSYVLSDGLEVPDPASRHQPDDVHGTSEIVDLTGFEWQTTAWEGRDWNEIVIYELHIGAFTESGTFLAAIAYLDHLKEMGVTAIQIMPVADFPGGHGWGYDGVLPYAPDASYGRPENLQALVDAAHERGICVFLDVVYNHFGPDGNYLPSYAPIFTDHHKTPWGGGVNYDGEGARWVREFIIQNAIYWIREYHLDGLRLDAVHAIKDDSEEHLLIELARRVRAAAGNRKVHLIVENENNDSELLTRDPSGAPRHFTAQWNDDIHHVLHVAATGESFGYYADYAGDQSKIGKALAEGFVYQGDLMPYRGEARGKSTAHLPPTAFISFIQNHDQIGNRALGDRMISSCPTEALRAVAAVYLLAPQIPMLFMGEEWGSRQPFPYFCDFEEELNEKVRNGRREELSRLPGFDAEDLPDPTASNTFLSAKLDWSQFSSVEAQEYRAFYQSLLAIRRERIVPLLSKIKGPGTSVSVGDISQVEWQAGDQTLMLICNLTNEEVPSPVDEPSSEKLFLTGSREERLAPWTVYWALL